ncbi:hypothetical protein CLAFUW4_06550 [Fulvia fulva]|uniref:Uncharacterized protein n=1 Tax=Passalora fulva TaxID=5499 RepID=A0A9Q8PBH8_PASFU|nr:uncharacterized protein CLAFUR5_06696 [Fulvia fulva]KAK4621839.1 hypothetical protein CLAFUR4_06558 [Fulvia fulva]KAK4623114.1 hypothetical protein CLAFUR0_06554 [Fulvia fulva]UJO19430.1 hypothetical protein CLAFUR5_06696 [Fulvia fulva]WPV16756.1 hypothetical protein CLAFUW4_06550 [Fulvia fulva]WPV31078.1 hypothetical protein CLAFUW7_06549 [Fulvia fulva]
MDADPWVWSAEQVAQFFQSEAATLIQDKPNSQLPDLVSLAQTLLDEGVAGADLLTQVDSNFLKEDCGIRQLGKRSSIIYCITRLRGQSDGYQQRDGVPGLRTPQSLNVLPPQPPSLLQQPLPTPALDSPGERVRSGEIAVQDRKGRKRRKLDLSATVEKAPTGGFMADSSLPIDNLFYGKMQFSREIGDLEPSANIEQHQTESNPDLEVYQIMSDEQPAGDVQYVYRQVKHLFMNDSTKHVKRRGRDAIAILPYRERLLPEGKAVSATVFVPDDGAEDGAMAVRENAAFLDEEVDYNESTEQQHTDGTWDYLTTNWKSKPDEDVLPEYGQSDAEDNEMPSDLEREVDEEEAERQKEAEARPGKEDIEKILEESIEALAQAWRAKKLEKLEEKQAWTVWKKMRGSKTIRDGLIANTHQQIRSFNERLRKQKRWIMEEDWTNAEKLQEQCEIMVPTIEDRELLLWKMKVWNRKQEPSHVIRRGHHSGSNNARQPAPSGPGFVLQPGDRLSVEPAEEQDEEMFHTPEGSQAGDQDDHGEEGDDEQDGAADDMDLDSFNDNFIVHESSPVPTVDDPNSSDVPITPSVRKNDGSQAPSSTPLRRREQTVDSDSDSDPLPALPKMPKSSSQRPKSEIFKTPTKKLAFSNSQSNPVVLSSDSEAPTSRHNVRKKGALRKPGFSADPLSDKKADVDSWELSMLIGKGDRLRFLIKLLAEAGHEQRKLIQSYVAKLRRLGFKALLTATLVEFQRDALYEGEDEKARVGAFCARLYMTFQSLEIELMEGAFDVDPVLAKIMNDAQQVEIFIGYLENVLRKSDSDLFVAKKPQANRSSSMLGSSPKSVIDLASDEELSEDEYQRLLKDTPRKKRKRKVKESESALQSQNNAAKRMERYQKTQISNSQQLVAMVQRDPTNSKISINPVKNEDDESIFIHQPIASVMKGHQIDGVRFMWREITADDGDETEPQGCLLTHTMGLGKTMQTIAVLVAVNEAAQSENLRVSAQLPAQLRLNSERERQLRIMVLCPPLLIENWRKEIRRWARHRLPNVFCIVSSGGGKNNHLDDMRTWYRIGGVLIIGYELFRNKVHRKESKSAKTNLANNRDGDELDQYLLRGPELVVADEVHNLRNRNAKSLAVDQIETHSRIGLSGTPLSNNVDEIYALISFASPGYLGETKEFKAHYATPIQAGLYGDSTPYEKRKSLMKLRVLHNRIEPKINRADINSLRGSIPPKTEFVITLPLTSIQQTAYGRFVSAVLGDSKNEKAGQFQMFSWLDLLGLLTTHPLAFKRKLLKPVVKKTRGRATSPRGSTVSDNGGVDIDDTEDLADEAVLNLGFSQETVDEIVEGITDELQVRDSAKMSMLISILELSAACGDKVLVFSGSLGTLDTVQQTLAENGVECGRIDGNVPPAKRLSVIAKFDKSSTTNVLLCSTRASGVGLNIQSVNRVVILDFGFNPTHEEQAVGRAYRLGQQKPVFVYRMVMGSTFEGHIYNKQLFKQSLFQRVVDRKNPRRVAQKNTRDFLFQPQHVEQKDISKWLGKDDKVLDRILRRELQTAEAAGSGDTIIRDLTTYETLQEDAGDEQFTEQEKREIQEEIEAVKRGIFFRPSGIASQAGPAPPPTAQATGLPAKNVRVTNVLPKQNVRRSVSGGKPGRPPSADKNGVMAPPPSTARPAAPAPMPHGLPTAYPPAASMPNQGRQRPPGQN